MVGDTGEIRTKDGKPVAVWNIVKLTSDPITNETITFDIQINKSLDPVLCLPNPEATCHAHGGKFPCKQCVKLAHDNY
jgi:hypothetical protein